MKKILWATGLIFLCLNSQAQWQRNTTIHGGIITSLLKTSGSIFSLSAGMDLYQSTNGGNSWTLKGNPEKDYNFTTGQGRLYINGSTLFMQNYSGLKRSTDNGATWTLLDTNAGGLGIEESAAFQNAIYTVSNTFSDSVNVLRSLNNGNSFQVVAKLPYNNYSIRSLNNKIYFFGNDFIFVSSNGSSFTPVSRTGLPSILFFGEDDDFCVGDGNAIYVMVQHESIYKFNGTSWQQATTGLPAEGFISSINFVNGALYSSFFEPATSAVNLYKSTNAATTWTKLPGTGLNIPFAYSLIADGTNLLAGFPDGLYGSSDGGNSWTPKSNQFTATLHPGILVQDNTLLTSSSFQGVYRSGDNGNSFSLSNTGLPSFKTSDVGQLLQSSDAVYAPISDLQSNLSLYKSTNTGQSWSKVNLPPGIDEYGSFFGNNGNTLFFVQDDIGNQKQILYRTTDQANTWQDISTKLPANFSFRYLFPIQGNGNTAYLQNEQSIYRSTDNGNNWTIDTAGLKLAGDPNPIFFAGIVGSDMLVMIQYGEFTTRYLYKRGTSKWEYIGPIDASIGRIQKMTSSGNYYYIQTQSDDRILVSSDKGAHFVPYTKGMPLITASNITGFVLTNNHILVSTEYYGIWRNSLFNGTTGIEELKNRTDGILAFPNPASDIFQLNCPQNWSSGTTDAQLMDVQGKVVKSFSFLGNNSSVDVSDLAPGAYMCTLTHGNERQNIKVMVNR